MGVSCPSWSLLDGGLDELLSWGPTFQHLKTFLWAHRGTQTILVSLETEQLAQDNGNLLGENNQSLNNQY